MEFEGLQ